MATVPVYEWLSADGSNVGLGTKHEFDHWQREGVIEKGAKLGAILTNEPASEDEARNEVLDAEWHGKLIIMACCATKRDDAQPMPAIDRYDGPMWSTLRARLAATPAAAAAFTSGDLRIWVMSARYGFIDARTEIPDYNERLSPELAAKMARDPSFDFQRIPDMVGDATAVLFAGGQAYRDAMWKASGASLWNIAKISETDAAGIGLHRAQIGAWFAEHYAAQPERLAA